MSMTTRACWLVLLSIPLQAELDVPLAVRNPLALERTGEPVAAGVPLPQKENITSTSSLLMTTETGVPVRSQFKVLARWDGAVEDQGRPIKWVLCEFPATVPAGGAATYRLKTRAGESDPAGGQVSISQDATHLSVDTGAMTFKIRKGRFAIEQVLVGGVPISAGESSLFVVESDTVYTSALDGSYRWTVERSGPQTVQVRATGRLKSAGGVETFRYDVRVAAFAGSTRLRLYATLIFDADMRAFRPSQITFSLPLLAEAGLYRFGGDKSIHSGQVAGSAHMVQEWWGADQGWQGYRVVNGGGPAGSGSRAEGWLDLSTPQGVGATVWVRNFWKEFPLEVEADGSKLAAHFWPKHGDYAAQIDHMVATYRSGTPLRTVWPYRDPQRMDMWSRSALSTGLMDMNYNAHGIAKTWETWFQFHSAPVASEQEAAKMNAPLIAVNPAWFTSTGALGNLGPAVTDPNSPLFRVEHAVEAVFDSLMNGIELRKVYGLPSYGDYFYSYNDTRVRYWLKARRNWNAGWWLLLARSGNRKYLDWAVDTSRHTMDIDHYHVNADFVDAVGNTVSRRSGASANTHETGNTHWNNRWGGDADGLDHASEGWALYYYLTGYDRARDYVLERGNHVAANRWERGACLDPTAYNVRNLAALYAVIYAYEMASTSEQRQYYRDKMDFHASCREKSYKEGGNRSPLGFFVQATWDLLNWQIFFNSWSIDPWYLYSRISNRPLTTQMFINAAKAMGAMGIKDDAHGTSSGGRLYGFSGLRAMAEAWRLTNDPEFLQNGKKQLLLIFGEDRGYTNATISLHEASQVVFTAPFLIKAIEDFPGGWAALDESPAHMLAYQRLPPASNPLRARYIFQETADQPWSAAFYIESAVDFFGAWPAATATLRVLDPAGSDISASVCGANCTFAAVSSLPDAHDPAKRPSVFTVPADSRTGEYVFEFHASNTTSAIAPVSNTLGKMVIQVGTSMSGETAAYSNLGQGLYYLWVPYGTQSFQVNSANNLYALIDREGHAYGVQGTAHSSNNQGGAFWAMPAQFISRTSVTNFTGVTSVMAIRGVKPILALRPSEWFDATSVPVISALPAGLFIRVNNRDTGCFITTPLLPSVLRGSSYSATLRQAGCDAGAWSVTGALPEGLTLDPATGVVSGSPTARAGSYPVTFRYGSATRAITMAVLDTQAVVDTRPFLIVNEGLLPPGLEDNAYHLQLQVSGGVPPYEFRITVGGLCDGLTLSPDGVISGVPVAGDCGFRIVVTDATGRATTKDHAIAVVPTRSVVVTTVSPLPPAVAGTPYQFQLRAAGGAEPYTWRLLEGSLCAGLALGDDGALTGTPVTPETCSFLVEVVEPGGKSGRRPLELTVLADETLARTCLGRACHGPAPAAHGGHTLAE